MIMRQLDTAVLPFDRARKLELGSLRDGGATWLLSVTEDAELVRRRGQWLSGIYIQEISSFRNMFNQRFTLWFRHSTPSLLVQSNWSYFVRLQRLCFLSFPRNSQLDAMGGIGGWRNPESHGTLLCQCTGKRAYAVGKERRE